MNGTIDARAGGPVPGVDRPDGPVVGRGRGRDRASCPGIDAEDEVASKGRKRKQPRPWQTDRTPPAPDPGERRARECRTKVAHSNRVAAEQAALEHERDFGQAKSVYECRWCGRWHVGTPR